MTHEVLDKYVMHRLHLLDAWLLTFTGMTATSILILRASSN